jgi:UDP-N-acetylglucosamine--N-acetylmuramyl-(pentapeptide) pyrophosphoryl-undecaprenol N-acetylglucosamine transferase
VNSPTFLFAGGGSGGHLFPGIAVAQQLREQFSDCRIMFVRSGRDIEQRVMSLYRFEHESFPSDFSAAQSNPVRLVWDYIKARKCAANAIRDVEPNVVIGMAGRASIPVVAVAYRKKIPVVLLEPNLVAGRTLSLLAKKATKICLSFEETGVRYRDKCVVTGNPMRPEIVDLYDEPSPPDPAHSLLVLGGSQGASAVNHIMVEVYRRLKTELADWHIVHQTGPNDVMLVNNCLRKELGLKGHVAPFIQELASEYRRASIVISRAGATTLAELACVGRPTIIVPYPNAVGDHQVENARFYENPGAARVVLQNDGSIDAMTNQLRDLLNNSAARESLSTAIRALARPYAARDTAAVISDCL